MTIAELTDKLMAVSVYDLRAATLAERAKFVTVCHGLISEVDRTNAHAMAKLETIS